jgi:hypothetical protein
VCVAYLRQTSRVNFRSTKVDTGNLKRKYLNRPWSTLAVNVLRVGLLGDRHLLVWYEDTSVLEEPAASILSDLQMETPGS